MATSAPGPVRWKLCADERSSTVSSYDPGATGPTRAADLEAGTDGAGERAPASVVSVVVSSRWSSSVVSVGRGRVVARPRRRRPRSRRREREGRERSHEHESHRSIRLSSVARPDDTRAARLGFATTVLEAWTSPRSSRGCGAGWVPPLVESRRRLRLLRDRGGRRARRPARPLRESRALLAGARPGRRAAAAAVHVLLTVFWHVRSTAEVVDRYDARTWVPMTARAPVARRVGAVSDPFRPATPAGRHRGFARPGAPRSCTGSREHRALVPGDVLLGVDGGGVRLCPDRGCPRRRASRDLAVAPPAPRSPRRAHPRLARRARAPRTAARLSPLRSIAP